MYEQSVSYGLSWRVWGTILGRFCSMKPGLEIHIEVFVRIQAGL